MVKQDLVHDTWKQDDLLINGVYNIWLYLVCLDIHATENFVWKLKLLKITMGFVHSCPRKKISFWSILLLEEFSSVSDLS